MQKVPTKTNNAFLAKLKNKDPYFLLLACTLLCTFQCLHLLTGRGYASPSLYNTYTLQAMAWRSGSLHLPHDYPWLELAIYEGNYYVSFPPLPSLVLLPLTFLFEEQTPDNLLVKIYGVTACLSFYAAMKEAGNNRPASALLAFLFTVSSSALPMMLEGAVWYQAQMLGLMLTGLSVMQMMKKRPTSGLFLYALSVCCRPFNAVYGPMLYLVYLHQRRQALYGLTDSIRRLVPGTLLGLSVAAAIAVFNTVRFGNPFEFGHNYLPEFSFQGGVQFSLSHIANNAKTFLFGSPLSFDGAGYTFNQFGYSLLIACPTVLLMIVQAVSDIVRKQFTFVKAAALLTVFVHIFLLLLHRTFGGFQLGARYAADTIPCTVCYFALCRPCGKRNALFTAVLAVSFLFTVIGLGFVHL